MFVITEDMLILLSRVKSDRRTAHFYGNLILAWSLENQRPQGLRFPYP